GREGDGLRKCDKRRRKEGNRGRNMDQQREEDGSRAYDARVDAPEGHRKSDKRSSSQMRQETGTVSVGAPVNLVGRPRRAT
ncbi:MAG: hypothetical protein ACK55Z_00400, partial [bacterium]